MTMELPKVIECSNPWENGAAKLINSLIDETIKERGVCNLMLTGGKTAARIYSNSRLFEGLVASKINIFLGDDRCVESTHLDSNFSLIADTLAVPNEKDRFVINRMVTDGNGYELMAHEYSKKLPEVVDVLLLSLGLDGHIASIFPNAFISNEEKQLVSVVQSPFHPHKRITISPLVITKARQTVLLAVGGEKGQVLLRALESGFDPAVLPVQLLMNKQSIWIVDSDAAFSLKTLEYMQLNNL